MVEHGMVERVAQPGFAIGLAAVAGNDHRLDASRTSRVAMENSCSIFALRSTQTPFILALPLPNSMEFCGDQI